MKNRNEKYDIYIRELKKTKRYKFWSIYYGIEISIKEILYSIKNKLSK